MIERIKKLLIPYLAPKLARYGGDYDGGYILNPELVSDSSHVYSYGVGPDESFITFDRHMSTLGKKVFMYDASVKSQWFSADKNFHFKSEYVNSSNISQHIKDNNHINNTNMILKMDIEGNEFETLINCDESVFSHFNQIGLEVHDILNSHNEKENIVNVQDEKLR
jgi:FkbM family methyltransferase